MRGAVRTSIVAGAIALCSGAVALAQSQPVNPTCQRLEAQLTSLDRGNADPTRAGQIRRADDAVNRQQFEVDKLVGQARRLGCGNRGFFSIFSNPPPQCGPLNRRIEEQRDVLDRMQNQLEQLQGGTTQRASQRQSLLIALADNGCGQQYRAAARAGQQGGFFDRLFGGGTIFSPQPSGPMGSTYRTICVRSCDGFYFRSRSRPRRIISATTSRPASACARPPTCSSTPITIPASKCRRRSRSTAGSTPSCRPRSSIARRWCRIALAAGRAKAGPRRLK